MAKIFNKFPKFLKNKWSIGGISMFILIVGGYAIFHKDPTYQFVAAHTGNITESISLTGNTTPAESVALSFGSSGIISHTYTSLGKKVGKGQVLADLNMSDLVAQLHQMQAALSVAKSNYLKLQNGASNPDVEVARVALQNAKNAYTSTVNLQKSLVANARALLLSSGLVATPSNGVSDSSNTPIISGSYNSTEEGSYIISVYATGGGTYFSVSGLENTTGPISTNPTPIGTRGLSVQFPSGFTATGATWTVSIPNTNSSSYVTYQNAYQAALQTQSQALLSAQGAVDSAQAAFDQKLAGARTEDLDIAQAQIDQAQANVESVGAKINNARIIAPISGTITQYDVKIGQLATLSTPLISVMSDTGYEVDAGVSETDVGKILVGNKVSMTLDAFPNEIFTGEVFYIAPSETNTQGVVSYQVKISFDRPDPRQKSGLTANIDIETRHKDNVIILPQYAILQNDTGNFVQTLVNNKIVEKPVTLGITDQDGNVEIISGVTDGEEVLNIGLKS